MLLWDQLRLDAFWTPRLAPSREGTRWLNVLKTLVACQLNLPPGTSKWNKIEHRLFSFIGMNRRANPSSAIG